MYMLRIPHHETHIIDCAALEESDFFVIVWLIIFI